MRHGTGCFWDPNPEGDLLSVIPGSTFHETVAEAIEIAQRLRRTLRFEFNGKWVTVTQHTKPTGLINAYWNVLGQRGGEIGPCGHPPPSGKRMILWEEEEG